MSDKAHRRRLRAVVIIDEVEIMTLKEASSGPEIIKIQIKLIKGVRHWFSGHDGSFADIEPNHLRPDSEVDWVDRGPLGREIKPDLNAILMVFDPKIKAHAKLAKKMLARNPPGM